MTPGHRSRLAGLVAAALAAAAGLVGLTSTPAGAAYCPGSGVNVVVDFNGLGGGVQKGCDPSGAGRSSDRVFEAAGFSLTPVNAQPGFICRVENKPAPSQETCARTPPANAYWGLFWSDGRSGKWNYATTGVNGLSVPQGGFVAFSWQNSDTRDAPSAAPTNAQATTTSTPAPTKTPTKKPTQTPTRTRTPKPTKPAPALTEGVTTRAAPSAVPTPPATGPAPTATPRATPSATATASESASSSTTLEPTPSDDPSAGALGAENLSSDFTPDEEPSGLPPWIPVSAVLALALAAFGGLWWRNRSGTS